MSKKKNTLTKEMVLAWMGSDEKEDIAGYIASILNDLANEDLSPKAKELQEEIYNYDSWDNN